MIALETPFIKSTSEDQDAFIKTSPVMLNGDQVLIGALDFAWRISRQLYENEASYTGTLTPATNGYFKSILILANKLGGFELLDGPEDQSQVIEPTVPVGKLRVTAISVFGSEFYATQPEAPGAEEKINRYGEDTKHDRFNIADELFLLSQKNATTGTGGNITSAQFAAFADYTYFAADFCIDSNDNIFVAQYTKNKIVKIAPDGTVSDFATISGGTSPIAIRVDGANNLWVYNSGNPPNRNANKITPAGVVTSLPISMGWAEYFLMHSNGELWFPDHTRIQRFSQAGAFLGYIDVQGFSSGAWGMGICEDSSGNVYVASRSTNKVSKIAAGGIVTQDFASVGTYPMGICVDTAGNVYTANRDSNTVSKISPVGVVTTINVGTAPTDVKVSADGKVYVTNSGSNNVSVILPDNSVSVLATVGEKPSKLLFDSDGNIFTLDNNSAKPTDVYKITIPTASGRERFLTTDENGNTFLKEIPVDQEDLDNAIAAEATARQNVDNLKADWVLGIETTASVNYTLALATINQKTVFTATNPIALNVPTNASVALPIGSKKEFTVQGTGAVTVQGAGVTFVGNGLTFAQGTTFILTKIATDTWEVHGDKTKLSQFTNDLTNKGTNTYYVDTVKGNNTTGAFEDASKPFATIDYVLGLSLTAGVTIVLVNAATHTLTVTFPLGIDLSIISYVKSTLDLSTNANTYLVNNGNPAKYFNIYMPLGTIRNERSGGAGGPALWNGNYNWFYIDVDHFYWNSTNYSGNGLANGYLKARKISTRGDKITFGTQMEFTIFPVAELVCLSSDTMLAVAEKTIVIDNITGPGNFKTHGGGGSTLKYHIGNISTTGTTQITGYSTVLFINSKITSAGGLNVGDGYPYDTTIIGKIVSCPSIQSSAMANSGSVKFLNFWADFGAGQLLHWGQSIIFDNCYIKCNGILINASSNITKTTPLIFRNTTIEQVTPNLIASGYGGGDTRTITCANLTTNATGITPLVGTSHTLVQLTRY